MRKVTLLLLAIFLASVVWGNKGYGADKSDAKQADKEYDATETIMHHIKDSHSWHLFDRTDKHGEKHAVSLPLPVILWYNGHLDFFMSSEFQHGHANVTKGDREYALHHDKVYVVKDGNETYSLQEHVQPIDFSITKIVAGMMFSALLLLVVFIPMARRYKKGQQIPKGISGFMEPIVLFIKDDIAIPNIGENKYQKFLPYLLTVFFFIWFNNMLGLIPIIPGGANVTGNIAVTMTLAVFTMIITNVNGNKNYWKHVFATPGVPKWLAPIMIPVELIGIISKPFALMVRLFANITAGHIIVLSLVSLIFIFKSAMIGFVTVPMVLFMDLLELMVALLQAYIFTILSALFIGMAVQEHH